MRIEDPDAGSCDAPINPQESIEFPELPRPRVPHCLDLIKDDATTVRPAYEYSTSSATRNRVEQSSIVRTGPNCR